jgi:hypothetical protein
LVIDSVWHRQFLNYQIARLLNYPISFAFSQFPAKLSQLFLLVGLQPPHHFSDSARMLRENLSDEFFSRGRNAGQYKAFVFTLLLPLNQPALLQVVDYKCEVSAAGKNPPRKLAEALRPYVKERLEHRKLAEREPSFT